MIKKLDIYIVKKFFGTFFLAILVIVLISVVFDISEKIDNFLSNEVGIRAIIFDYYMSFIPWIVNLLTPLICFIAVIFFTSQMAARTEIVAILSCGVSYKRMLVPYMFCAFVLVGMSYGLANYVIPNTNKKRIKFEQQYLKGTHYNMASNIHLQMSPGVFVYVKSFQDQYATGYNFTLEKLDKDGKLYYKLHSSSIVYDSINSCWEINQYVERQIFDNSEILRKGAQIDTNFYDLLPSDFSDIKRDVGEMNRSELRRFIAREKIKGGENLKFYLVARDKRTSEPFAIVVLTIIGVALSSRKVRGGIGVNLVVGLTLSALYILFMQLFTSFGSSGLMYPWISVWLPNLIFSIVGVYLLSRAQQ